MTTEATKMSVQTFKTVVLALAIGVGVWSDAKGDVPLCDLAAVETHMRFVTDLSQ
jgi:hypothetical protein